jgi:hypothetical protein
VTCINRMLALQDSPPVYSSVIEACQRVSPRTLRASHGRLLGTPPPSHRREGTYGAGGANSARHIDKEPEGMANLTDSVALDRHPQDVVRPQQEWGSTATKINCRGLCGESPKR